MSKTLHLTLQKKWFDRHMQDKNEEYREIKKYWVRRLVCLIGQSGQFFDQDYKYKNSGIDISNYFLPFDKIEFTNGYGSHMPTMVKQFKGIRIGRGNPEWGAPTDRDVFIIECGKILTTKNISDGTN